MKNSALDVKTLGAKLRKLRESSGYSLRELSARSGIAVSFLSKVETGKASPTIMSLQRILEALNAEVTEFFRDESSEVSADAVLFPRGKMHVLEEEDRTWVYAFPSHPSVEIDLSYEEYQPHTGLEELERHPMDVCGLVLEGELTIEIPGHATYRARKGDGFYLKAGTPHISRNESGKVLRLVVAKPTRWARSGVSPASSGKPGRKRR
ncbi:MAG TPA: cupin domain-containing protein [Candidatus Hydrogenedentes bacterium]|nr:cupin domain-containing protein [Candidatus Hydrogenedentota bacterium]